MLKSCLAFALLTTAASIRAAPDAKSGCAAAAAYSAQRDGVSLLVMRDGKIVCEDYPAGNTAASPHLLASGTKSFTGIMAAAAAQDKLLTIDEPVAATITEWQTDPRKAKVTIRQLLGLIGGVSGGNIGNVPTYADAVATPFETAPGTTFRYGPVPFQIFGEVMRRKLVAHKLDGGDPLAYLTRRVLDPIGMKAALWRRGADGNPNLPSGAALTAREWIKVGEFMRLGGRWNGRQLVDAATLAQLTKSGPVNPSYGISWWVEGARGARPSGDGVTATVDLTQNADTLPPGVFLAAGAGIQRLYVVPSEKLVVVRQAVIRPRAERRAQRQTLQGELRQAGNTEAEAREAIWSDTAFLKLLIGR